MLNNIVHLFLWKNLYLTFYFMKESLHYLLMSDHFLFQKKMGV